MVIALFLAGIFSILLGLYIGVQLGAFWTFLISFLSGMAISCIFFALANVLENQERILDKVEAYYHKRPIEKKACGKCEEKYDGDMSSCPYCGYRE